MGSNAHRTGQEVRTAKERVARYFEATGTNVTDAPESGIFELPNGEITTLARDAVIVKSFDEKKELSMDDAIEIAYQLGVAVAKGELELPSHPTIRLLESEMNIHGPRTTTEAMHRFGD